jgi:hypothetical protein
MRDLIIEAIERSARVTHGGDVHPRMDFEAARGSATSAYYRLRCLMALRILVEL